MLQRTVVSSTLCTEKLLLTKLRCFCFQPGTWRFSRASRNTTQKETPAFPDATESWMHNHSRFTILNALPWLYSLPHLPPRWTLLEIISRQTRTPTRGRTPMSTAPWQRNFRWKRVEKRNLVAPLASVIARIVNLKQLIPTTTEKRLHQRVSILGLKIIPWWN